MEPTKEQWFWEQCGWKFKPTERSFGTIDWPDYIWHTPDGKLRPDTGLPSIDLNNLFKYAPEYIVGIQFGFYPGGVRCEVTYMDEAGFTTVESFIPNTEEEGYREANSKKKAALALFWAIYKALGGEDEEPDLYAEVLKEV